MKINQYLSALSVVTVFSLSMISCNGDSRQTSADNALKTNSVFESEVDRGKYLVGIMGCNDCHSPKRLGENGPEIIPELMLSGYPSNRPVVTFDSKMIKEGFAMFYPDLTAAAGPWGISFAGNLTPHETGIGNWTEEQFKKALTEGVFKGLDNSRMLLPPMPWVNYAEMKDEDIQAIFAYLKSIKPVDNLVPSPVSPDNM
ncbi:MAG: c-type cytochrome [Balneolaceae bacterium]